MSDDVIDPDEDYFVEPEIPAEPAVDKNASNQSAGAWARQGTKVVYVKDDGTEAVGIVVGNSQNSEALEGDQISLTLRPLPCEHIEIAEYDESGAPGTWHLP